MLASRLKEKIRNGEKTVGIFMTFDFWPGYLEILKKSGFDFVVIDTEHGWLDVSKLEELCRLGRALDFPVLIRPEWHNYVSIKKAFDIGPGGLMMPWVETMEELEEIRYSIQSPPRGIHGMGGPSILAVDGVGSKDWELLESSMLFSCQVETPTGVALADKMAECDFLDIIMLGPYDLASNMGLVDNYLCEEHKQAILEVRDKCHAKGKPVGMVVGNGAEARAYFDEGFDLIIIGSLLGVMRQGLKNCINDLKNC